MLQPPEMVQSLMREFKPHWFIAGGWAIDLFLGAKTREHDDIEIAIFRNDQIALQEYLGDWNLQIAADGKLSEWKTGEFLELPVHAIHCFSENPKLPFLEVLLNESDDKVWQFRRNRQITKPLREIYLTNDAGIRFLCPEVVLLYKSKNPRAKDEQDFLAAVKQLENPAKKWLKNALSACYSEHKWLELL
jgi:hypothetical protein